MKLEPEAQPALPVAVHRIFYYSPLALKSLI
jgi:hypothetical protein